MQQCLEVGAVGAPYLFKRVLQCLVGPGREQSLFSPLAERTLCVSAATYICLLLIPEA